MRTSAYHTYVPNSDNKYVQFRLISKDWNTSESNWQGVDKEPVSESKNLLESGGIYLTKEKVDVTVEESNLFWGNDAEISSVKFTWTDNGISIVGTASTNIKLSLRGAISIDKSILPAGTYTASMSGDTTNDISLRYNVTSQSNGTRWVNNIVKKETVTFAEDTVIILYVSANNTYNNIIRIQINEGDEALPYSNNVFSAKDIIARNLVNEEKTRAQSSEQNLLQTINTEKTRAEDVENNIIYKIDNIIEESNLFWGNDAEINGITFTFGDNGLSIVGTATYAIVLPLRGATSIENSKISAGTYTAKIIGTTTNDISLRYNVVSSVQNGIRWVNNTV